MAQESNGKRCAFMTIGIIVMIGGFFGGFVQFFWAGTHDVGTILFYVLVVPMISFVLGFAIMMYGMKDSLKASRIGLFGVMASPADSSKERTFIHEPPAFCKDCGASLSAETIEWVGPLTIRCPYCGASHPTEKREV
jgi:hypothetical protein